MSTLVESIVPMRRGQKILVCWFPKCVRMRRMTGKILPLLKTPFNAFFQSLLAIDWLIYVHATSVERAYAQNTRNPNVLAFEVCARAQNS